LVISLFDSVVLSLSARNSRWSPVRPLSPRSAPQMSLERRLARMLDRLAQGGEVAQGVVRELFPGRIWLYQDPNGGRFLWAHAQTAMPTDWTSLLDAKSYLAPEHWPRVYNEIATESRNAMRHRRKW